VIDGIVTSTPLSRQADDKRGREKLKSSKFRAPDYCGPR
jgi:hypothetical protein